MPALPRWRSDTVLFVSGEAGAGKSTAVSSWVSRGVPRLSVGDELRALGAVEPSRGFGDDDTVRSLVSAFLGMSLAPSVVDGYPRRPHQVAEMLDILTGDGEVVPFRAEVWWFVLPVEEAVARYEARSFAWSPRSGKIGPRGASCPAGGVYSEPVGALFRRRRRQQELELALTLAELRQLECGGLRLVVVDGAAFREVR